MAKKTRKAQKPTTFEGLPVVDATKDAHLVINKKDVTESRKKDPGSCAAALAGRREFHTDVRVFLSRMYVKDKKNKCWVRFVTPSSVSREITSFDRGAGFEPGEYSFKAPYESAKLGHRQHEGGEKTHTGKGKKPRHITANVRVSAKTLMNMK